MAAMLNRLTKHHGFALTPEDRQVLDELVYRSFFASGPDIRYSFPRPYSSQWFPDLRRADARTDGSGTNHSYIANEEQLPDLRDLERSNLIVPVVGDFGGPKAIRAVGGYLRSTAQP